MRLARAIIFLLALCVVGCTQKGPESDLDSYVDKLHRVLGQPEPEEKAPPQLHFPTVREFRHTFHNGTINILQFLEIRDCELGHLVAERNSVLGKVAVPSQRLVYEINFLRTGDACLKIIGDDHPKLAAALQKELTETRRELPVYIWQATLGSDEFRQFWHFGVHKLPAQFGPDNEVVMALNELNADTGRWLAGDYVVDSDHLEHLLDVVRSGDGGLELRAWLTLSYKLDVATTILRDRESRRPLCFKGMHTRTADIFGNVVKEELIGKIQPWVAQLNARYYGLFPAIRALESELAEGEPPAYHAWREQRDTVLAQATQALVRHVGALQPLLTECNLMPATR